MVNILDGERKRVKRCDKRHYFYIPKNFDAAAILPAHLKKYADNANYMVHLVVVGGIKRKANRDGFVNLAVDYLRQVTPDRVEREIRQSLIGRVLECDRQYIKGEKAMGYRLCPEFRVASRRVECRDIKTADRVARVRNVVFRTDTKLPVHKHLAGWLNELEIDVERAEEIILSNDAMMLEAHQHFTAVQMIADGHMDFSYCRYGRVHSIVTRLKRELRAALSINGEPLVNIDIANSQPLILALLLPRENRDGGTGANSIMMSICNGKMTELDVFKGVTNTQKRDIREYINLCEKGEFYEHMSSVGRVIGMTRDEVKVKVFREILFGRNQNVTDFTRLFAAEFPNVMSVIRQMKKRDHAALACTMQKEESTIVIHGACRRLMLEYPHIPLITIHDSAVTTPKYVPIVRRAMLDAFAAVGLRPKFKIDEKSEPMRMAA